MDSGTGTITLAVSLSALKRLENTTKAFNEAVEWSTYVGVVSDRSQPVVMNYTRKHRLPKNFVSRPEGEKQRTLEDIKHVSSKYEETDRYVFVGTSDADRRIAEEADWEYVPLEKAAEAAGWRISSKSGSVPVVEEDKRNDWP